MHKIYLLIAVLIFIVFTNADAQLTKGSLWLGGSIYYGASSSQVEQMPASKQKNNALAFAPYIGRVVKENSIAGISLQYRTSTGKSAYVKNADNSYGAGLFYRKYKDLGKGFYLFGNGEVSYLYGKRRFENFTNTDYQQSTSHTVRISGYPGIAYALNPSIHLEVWMGDLVAVSFSDVDGKSQSQNNMSKDHSRSVQVNTSLNQLFNQWAIGFRFLLNGKRVNRYTT